MSTVNSEGPPLPPGSRKNIRTRPLGAKVGPSLWLSLIHISQRISFSKDDTNGTYSTPVWSPRGDYIAFTKQGGGQFSIGIMKPDGSGERILTSGFHNEGPTFAPNGRCLLYTSRCV